MAVKREKLQTFSHVHYLRSHPCFQCFADHHHSHCPPQENMPDIVFLKTYVLWIELYTTVLSYAYI